MEDNRDASTMPVVFSGLIEQSLWREKFDQFHHAAQSRFECAMYSDYHPVTQGRMPFEIALAQADRFILEYRARMGVA